MANPSKMPSLEGIIRNLQSEGFGGRELGIWLSSGSRWARLASAASKRLTYRIGSEISCTVLAEVCHQIRSPSLAQLQRIYRLPSTLDIANVEATDWFFDLFYHRMVVNVPRDGQLWKDVLKCAPTEGNSTSFYSFNQRHLNSSFGTEKPAVTAWDDVGPLSDEELEESLVLPVAGDTKVALPPPKIIAFFGDILKVETDIRGTLHVIKSCFSSRRALAETGLPYTVDNRNDWTEEQRKRVDKAERPRTLEKFAEKIQQHYDSSLGTIRAQQKWLVLTKAAIAGREVKVVDAEDNTIVTVDASLPEEYRSCLENAVAALCKATAVDILDLNTSQLPADRLFDVWHLSYYARYGQSVFSWKMYQGKEIPPDFHPLHIKRQDGSKVNHCQFFVRASKDLQTFGKEFAALSEAIGPVLQKIVEKRLARDYDLFGSEVEAMVDVMPLQDFTPVRPFTGLVINSSTQIGMVYRIKEMEMAGWTILGLVPAWGYRQHHPSTLAEKTMLHAVEAFPVYGLEEMKEGLTLGYLQKCVMSTKYSLFMQWKRIMYHVDEVLPVYTLGEVKEGLIMYHVDEVFPVYALEEVKEGLWVHHLWNL
ncbi:hypothetical protein F5878DRAFT_647116 [Lentinula raphanica]|uniref:Uncharacterized protein n=1 Tax=Lentinula raphanica TaxID=153919 RepID=A0AA38NWQ3_9AGAR|nr:hypothetical protein F5878DRAFT_647116 [Lentinula raphanica]